MDDKVRANLLTRVIGEELGNFRVLAPIGKGGMAAVYVGEHMLLGNRVAIKVLQQRHLANPAIERRFFNEAKVIAAIRHPNIVEILDFGRAASGSAYIVMELLEGETLRHRIRRGVMPERQSVLFMRQLASGLAEAHAQGIVHRDLKPDNVFIIADEEVEFGERVKLLDFGIAKCIQTDVSGPAGEHTATGILIGTPAYMSPEQCKGQGDLDGRSDIYSLGVVLYRMLTNQLPFEAGGTGELIGKHLFVEPVSPRELNESISVEVDRIVMCCLQKNPDQRFATMADLASTLAELLRLDKRSTSHLFNPPAIHSNPPAIHPNLPANHSSIGSGRQRSFQGHDHDHDHGTRSLATIETRPSGVIDSSFGAAVSYIRPPKRRRWSVLVAISCAAALAIGFVALGWDQTPRGGSHRLLTPAEAAPKPATRLATKPVASSADVSKAESVEAEQRGREGGHEEFFDDLTAGKESEIRQDNSSGRTVKPILLKGTDSFDQARGSSGNIQEPSSKTRARNRKTRNHLAKRGQSIKKVLVQPATPNREESTPVEPDVPIASSFEPKNKSWVRPENKPGNKYKNKTENKPGKTFDDVKPKMLY